MAHDVFISHSSKDKPIADAICAKIEAAGVRCWIAPRDISPGEDWPAAIYQGISQSRVMVLVFSSHSNSSEDVSREIILAANSKLVIIPFKIENVEPEPGKQYYLARMHWLDAINPPTQEQIQELVSRVKVLVPPREPEFIRNQTDAGMPPATTVQVDQLTHSVTEALPGSTSKPISNKSRLSRWIWLVSVGVILICLFGWAASSLFLKNPASPIQPTTFPTSTSTPKQTSTLIPTPTPMSYDFNDASFDGSFNSSQWIYQSDFSDISIKQANGAMVLSKPSPSGMENGSLKTNQTWLLGEFSYVEARLKLDQEHTGEMGNVGFSLGDVGCAVQIQGKDTTPFIWCAQSHIDSDQQWIADYMSGSYFIEYGKWYTVRIEFDSQTNEFKCYIDGELFYSWQPTNIGDLLGNKSSVSLGIWADNGTTIIGYVDDVRIVK
jgi:hypothetical protein